MRGERGEADECGAAAWRARGARRGVLRGGATRRPAGRRASGERRREVAGPRREKTWGCVISANEKLLSFVNEVSSPLIKCLEGSDVELDLPSRVFISNKD